MQSQFDNKAKHNKRIKTVRLKATRLSFGS